MIRTKGLSVMLLILELLLWAPWHFFASLGVEIRRNIVYISP